MSDLADELKGDSVSIARRILGSLIIRSINGKEVICRIVETEAYDQNDQASHSYHGKTKRNEVMFGSPGHAYIYFTYGMHYCLNIVVGPKDYGSAVLIRAVEPLSEIDIIRRNRSNMANDIMLTNGPAKLCQALNLDLKLNGHDLSRKPFRLVLQPEIPSPNIGRSSRVGIKYGLDKKWRLYIKNNPYVSR